MAWHAGEVNVLFVNLFIFYFFSHVEAYIVSSKDLSMPAWLRTTRLVAMVVNFIGGNICLAVVFGARRTYLSLLPQLWCGLVSLLTAVALGGVAYTLAREVKRQCVHLCICTRVLCLKIYALRKQAHCRYGREWQNIETPFLTPHI